MPTKKINNYVIYLDGDSKLVKIKKITLSATDIIMHAGDKIALNYSVYPKNASYSEITWESDNVNIADIDEDGIITAKKNGTTTIRLTINKKTVTCKVRVIEIIHFADNKVKQICVRNWDKDGDGEISIAEAASVKEIPLPLFTGAPIETFDELTYFTGLKTIGMHAFDSCTYLTSISFPYSLEKIGKNAFAHCSSLKIVNITPCVTAIGSGAFSYCDTLETVNVNNPNPPTAGKKIFDYSPELNYINVPDISIERYCNTNGWGVDENNDYLYYSYIWPHGFDYTFDFFLS